MNSHLARPEPAVHQAVQQLLPWLLAGTLDSAELAMTQRHLQTCARCQSDLAWQRKLRAAAAAAPDAGFDADRGFAQLLPRLGPHRGPQTSTSSSSSSSSSSPRFGVLDRWRQAAAANSAWLKWTALAQLAAIGVLSLLLARPWNDATGYRAMGGPGGGSTAGAADAVVVFRPDTPEREIRRILQAGGARVVDGPTVTGAYVLALPLPPSRATAALARMRAESAVTLAQPLAEGRRP
jgi:anti-sigma factor RsiW